MKKLSEFDGLTNFFFEREPYEAADLVPRKESAGFVRDALAAAAGALRGLDDWSAPALEAAMQALVDGHGWKRGSFYMLLRVAVTCRAVSTPLFETMQILGKDECLARVEDAVEKAKTLS